MFYHLSNVIGIVILQQNGTITNKTINWVDCMVEQNMSLFLRIKYFINYEQISPPIYS